MGEPTDLKAGDGVEKFKGDYGGPGTVVGVFEVTPGELRVAVAFRIENGFGRFVHLLRPDQVRRPGDPRRRRRTQTE